MGIIQDLLAQRQEIEARLKEEMRKGKADALRQIRQIASEYSITPDEVSRALSGSGGTGAHALSGLSVAPKYRDPQSGKTWTGRGMKPLWMKAALENGASMDSFLIDAPNKPAPTVSLVQKPRAAAKKATKKKAA